MELLWSMMYSMLYLGYDGQHTMEQAAMELLWSMMDSMLWTSLEGYLYSTTWISVVSCWF
jgi:hypothetical protein